MQKINIIVITALMLNICLTVNARPEDDSLRFEILLTSKMLKSVNLDPKFISTVDITPSRHLLLSTPSQFYLLGWGGIEPLGKSVAAGAVRSFAFSPDSLLMIVRKNEICYFDAAGALKRLCGLPSTEMGISAGSKTMYLYGQSAATTGNAVYLLSPGGKYALLFEVDLPVRALAEFKNSLLFASGNMVCSFDMETKDHKVLATLAADKKVLSVTVDTAAERVYFSTDKAIYAINDSSAITVSENIGGILRFFAGGLIIFDPGKQFLVRIAGVEEELKNARPPEPTVTGQQSPGVLTNASVTDLVKSELSEELIIAIIQRSEVAFDLSIDAMIELSNKGVSSAIIMEMRKAMKRQMPLEKNK